MQRILNLLLVSFFCIIDGENHFFKKMHGTSYKEKVRDSNEVEI